MGSFGKGSDVTTTTQNTAPAPEAMAAYRALMQRAAGVAARPYEAYEGDLSAPINTQQQLGIGNINQYAGFAQPYIQNAGGFAQDAATMAAQSGQPITETDISRYQNPYQQQVVDAVQAQFNRQNAAQQNDLRARAAMSNALGGSSPKIAAADLAYQQQLGQAPAIANLYSQGFNAALSAAQNQQRQALQSAMGVGNQAGTLGNLGVAGQQAGLAGAGAQFGAGSAMQQSEQERLNRLYQQYQTAQSFPYMQTQWLAGLQSGVGSNMGGTGTKTTDPPNPNPLNQVLGLGLAAAGAYFGGPAGASAGYTIGRGLGSKYGGRIRGFAEGGSALPYGGVGWIPQIGITKGRLPDAPDHERPQQQGQSNTQRGLGDFASALRGSASSPMNILPSGAGFTPSAVGDFFPTAAMGPTTFGMGPIYRDGGKVIDLRKIGVGHYADGGDVPFDDRWAPVTDALNSGDFDPQGANFPRILPGFAPEAAPPGTIPGETIQINGGNAFAGLPPEILGDDDLPPSVMAYDAPRGVAGAGAGPQPPMMAGVGQGASAPAGGGFLNLSDDARMALLAAGLGMMASRSPHLGVAIGEGGMQGVQAYAERKAATQKKEEQAARLAQQAEQFRQSHALRTQAQEETSKHNRAIEGQYGKATVPFGWKMGADGIPVPLSGGPADPDYIAKATRAREQNSKVPFGWEVDDKGLPVPLPGGPADPAYIEKAAKAKSKEVPEDALLDGDTIKFMAQQYRAGDTSVLTNLGRGAQGAKNIVELRKEIQRQNVSEGTGGADQAMRNAEFFGTKAGQRTLGTRQANIELAAQEFKQVLPVVQDASKAVSRTNFPDLNKIIQAYNEKTGDPNIVAFGGGINTLINLYARAISPSGTPTVSDKDHAREILSKAWSQGQFDAAVGMMSKEIDAALTSPGKVRDEMRQRFLEGQGRREPHSEKPAETKPGTKSDVPRVNSIEEARKLPKGSKFIDPNGVERTVP